MIRSHNEELKRLNILQELVHAEIISIPEAMAILQDHLSLDDVEIDLETEDTEMSLP